jgi:hypothetical protein
MGFIYPIRKHARDGMMVANAPRWNPEVEPFIS